MRGDMESSRVTLVSPLVTPCTGTSDDADVSSSGLEALMGGWGGKMGAFWVISEGGVCHYGRLVGTCAAPHGRLYSAIMAGRPKRTSHKMTPPATDRFLASLADNGEWKAACAAAGITRQTAYFHHRENPDFAEACEAALGRLDTDILATARRLAIDGVDEPIFSKTGEQVGTRKRYDTRILLRWLERRYPAEWGKKVQVDQNVSGTVEHRGAIRPEDLSADQRRCVRRLLTEKPSEN